MEHAAIASHAPLGGSHWDDSIKRLNITTPPENTASDLSTPAKLSTITDPSNPPGWQAQPAASDPLLEADADNMQDEDGADQESVGSCTSDDASQQYNEHLCETCEYDLKDCLNDRCEQGHCQYACSCPVSLLLPSHDDVSLPRVCTVRGEATLLLLRHARHPKSSCRESPTSDEHCSHQEEQ